MTDLRTAAQQALEALERTVDCGHDAHECANVRAITALRAALAEPVQEPVATMTVREDMGADFKFSRPHTLQPGQQFYLCATLPQRPAEPVQDPFLGWLFKRNADGSIGICAPPPKPGESKRTSDCVGTNQKDLNELLGKLADHMAALAEPQDPDSPERRCGGPGCDGACCQPVQEPQGCAHCNHPLYAAVKCKVCGRVKEPTPLQRKPLSEEEKRALADKFLFYQPESYEVSGVFDLISAVERAHGITP